MSSGFDGASTHTRSALRRRLAGLVEVDPAQSPAAEIVDEQADAVVRIAGERDGLPVVQQAEQYTRRGGEPGREQERMAAVERAEGGLCGLAGWMPVAGIRELPRPAIDVRPDGRSIDCRPGIHV